MSVIKELFFPSEVDSLSISVMQVIPDKQEPRGIFQLVHGMCEHKERYLPFMEYLAGKGYVCVINDIRGHGKSVKEKDDLGYMYGGGAEAVLADTDAVNRMIRDEYPGLPLILFGHSMGALIVRAYASQHDDRIDGLIICGTPVNTNARPVGEGIANVEMKLYGPKHRSVILTGMSMGSYAARFKEEKDPLAWLSVNEENRAVYKASDLCGFLFTDDAFLALFGLMKIAYDTGNWSCKNPALPVLFISGADDPCMGNIRKFSQAVKSMQKAGYKDVRGKIYKGMRHEILNETENDKVFADILKYIHSKGM
ncbi:MAG: alpha/beta fold hydrolase [Blautia sp.]|nr:alpha/beta fold hydrolase [Blautia sp.]